MTSGDGGGLRDGDVDGQLTLELEGIDQHKRGALHDATRSMIEDLDRQDRLTAEHLPMVALLYRLADALEVAGGRGASVALLSAQFQGVWERLHDAPAPVVEVGTDEDQFDVQLLTPATPDAG
jgi:hypothetical protein